MKLRPAHLAAFLFLSIAPSVLPAAPSVQGQVSMPVRDTVSSTPPYVVRGDTTEVRYERHRGDLGRFFQRLDSALRAGAPDLAARLQPPKSVPYGYQILPAITSGSSASHSDSIILSPFSWPRADSVIVRGKDSLSVSSATLDSLLSTPFSSRRSEYEALSSLYMKLDAGQRFMASLIRYNRLWQGEIARRPAFYDRANHLKVLALRQQELLRELRRDTAEKFVAKDRRHAQGEALARSLGDTLIEAMRKFPTPRFVTVDSVAGMTVTLPLYTDILDQAFLAKFKFEVMTPPDKSSGFSGHRELTAPLLRSSWLHPSQCS